LKILSVESQVMREMMAPSHKHRSQIITETIPAIFLVSLAYMLFRPGL